MEALQICDGQVSSFGLGWWNGIHDGLRSRCRKACRFKSCPEHQTTSIRFSLCCAIGSEHIVIESIGSSRGAERRKPDTITVIGAGLGGLALARTLYLHGLEVQVYDRDVRTQRASSMAEPSS